MYLHDVEQYSENKEAVFSKGKAQFTFKDLLLPNCKELKLRSDVMPTKRINNDNTKNLDLNTTAKINETGLDKLNPYLVNHTYCVIKANLAFPI